MFFGDWDLDNYADATLSFFIIITLFLPLVLLNLLVAIMSDTYAKIQENSEVIDIKGRINLSLELADLLYN